MIFRVVSLLLMFSAPAFADGAYLLLAVPMGFFITPMLGWVLAASFWRAATRGLASKGSTRLTIDHAKGTLTFIDPFAQEPGQAAWPHP